MKPLAQQYKKEVKKRNRELKRQLKELRREMRRTEQSPSDSESSDSSDSEIEVFEVEKVNVSVPSGQMNQEVKMDVLTADIEDMNPMEREALDHLSAMGFQDVETNRRLVNQYHGNMDLVLEALLENGGQADH